MKDLLLKNIHTFIILYTIYNLYEIYELKDAAIISEQNTLVQADSKLKKSKASLDEVDRFNKNLEESRKRVQVVVENIKKIQRQLPSEINDAEVQSILSGMAKDLRLKDYDMKPKEEISKGFYFSKDYVFDAKGTFLQGLILFEKLEKLSQTGRILNVKSLRMTLNPDGDKRSRFKVLNLSTVVESYRYNPNYQVGGE